MHFVALAAVLVLLSCGGSSRGGVADDAAGDVSDGSGEQATAQPGAEQTREAGAVDTVANPAAGGGPDSVPACRDGRAGQGLPQGPAGLGFDGSSVGMVEVFAGLHHGSGGRDVLQPVQLVPASARPDWAELLVVEGYEFELLDSDGAVVHSEPLRGRLWTQSPGLEWEMHITERPPYASLRIRHGDRSIAEASGSASPPLLRGVEADVSEALRPPVGMLPSQVLFRWTACDPDADTLWQYTYYSIDDGASYQLVDETLTRHRPDDPTTTTTTIIYDDNWVDYRVPGVADTSQPRRYTHFEQPWNLPEGDRAHFVVVVSDGLRWSAALSEPFEPAPHPQIHVSVREPVEGAVLRPQEEIRLIAEATGALVREWRRLPHSMFRWSSDIDGEITPEPPTDTDYMYPSDRRLLHGLVPEGFLSPGTHRITATATDETGNTGSATVTVEVRP